MKKNILLILCYINLSFASTTIDQQIAAIKEAPANLRVQMMNNLKRQLILMNQEERQQTIHKLRQNAPQTSPITPQTDRDVIEYQQLQSSENPMLTVQEAVKVLESTPKIELTNPPTPIPQVSVPEIQVPQATPEVKIPEMQTPQVTPEVKIPEMQTPQATPEVKIPEMQTPQATPEVKIPEMQTPQATPEVKIPEMQTPQATPEVKIPEEQIPQATPQVKVPEIEIPEVESSVPTPEARVPEIKIPEEQEHQEHEEEQKSAPIIPNMRKYYR